MDDFYGSDHRPVYSDLEIPLDFPDFYQIIRGQFTQDALYTELESIIKINRISIKNVNYEFIYKESGKLPEFLFPCNVSCKFCGDIISSGGGTVSMENTIFLPAELKEDIDFSDRDCPIFSCVPNVVEWIKKCRLMIKVIFDFKSFKFSAFATIPLHRIEEQGLCVAINNNDGVSRNTRICTLDVQLTFCSKDQINGSTISFLTQDTEREPLPSPDSNVSEEVKSE